MNTIREMSVWTPTFTLASGTATHAINKCGNTGLIQFDYPGVVCTLQVRHNTTGNFTNWTCRDINTGTMYAGGTSVTSASGLTLAFDARNVNDVQLTYVSGDGAAYRIGTNPADPDSTALNARHFTVALVPTISASPDYSANDVVGGIQTITGINSSSGRPVQITSLAAKDKNGQSPALSFIFFKSTPTGGT